MTRILIRVTQEDIDLGVKHNCNYCPIARALARTLKVGLGEARVGSAGGIWGLIFFYFPCEATDFIRDFDRGMPVKPFDFESYVAEKIQ